MKSSVVIVRGQSWALSWHSAASWRHMQEPPNGAPRFGVRRYQWQPGQRAYGVYCYQFALRWVRTVSVEHSS